MPHRQLPFAFEHRTSFAGEDFLIAGPNHDAVRWLDRWPDWPSPALVIHGPAGCGKTHLAHVFLERCRGLIIDDDALRRDRTLDLAVAAAGCIVDDADRLVGAGLETPLLHLYNVLAEHGRHLLLTAATPSARWSMRLSDLRSRLNAAPSVGIGLPDDDLIAGLLAKLFADRQLAIDDEVISYLLPRIQRSFAAARRLTADLDAAALSHRRKITVALAREVLKAAGDN